MKKSSLKNKQAVSVKGRPDRLVSDYPAQRAALFDEKIQQLSREWLADLKDDRLEKAKQLTLHEAPRLQVSNPPQPHEWDFRSLAHCSEAEREACLEYELSREVPMWRTMAYNFDHILKYFSRVDQIRRIQQVIYLFPHLWSAQQFAEWPNHPWLTLDRKVREDAPGSLNWGWSSLYADLSEDRPAPSPEIQVRRKKGKVLVYPNFSIDLTQNDARLKSELVNWLFHWRKAAGCAAVERRGTRTPMDVLKSLGAYRLLKAMEWHEAREVSEDANFKSYRDEAAWSKAKTRAQRAICQFATGQPLSVVLSCAELR